MTVEEQGYVNRIRQSLYAILAKYHYIVCIDPGGTTGMFEVQNPVFDLQNLKANFDSSIIETINNSYPWPKIIEHIEDTEDTIANYTDNTRSGLIVYENFRCRPRIALSTANQENLQERIIGGLECLIFKDKNFDYLKVEPTTHKQFSTKFKLNIMMSIIQQANGTVFSTQHQKDALSLFLYAIMNQDKIRPPI